MKKPMKIILVLIQHHKLMKLIFKPVFNLEDWIQFGYFDGEMEVLTRIRVFLTPIGVSVKQKCFCLHN